jgi:class 3 adenylate cyclase
MERRLAAILAADVVGYSRLMAADEQGTHARLKALRRDFLEPRIAEHHGRVVKLMGDGALIMFASVINAIECAVGIQRGVAERQSALPDDQRIVFRIGINIGDIIVEDSDVIGDGVNIAARLEKLADPGGIWVARNVYNQVGTKLAIGFEPTGEHLVKNIPEPIFAYRVLVAPGSATKGIASQPANLDPAEAAHQEWMERTATTASYVADLSRQSESLNSLLRQMRTVLATNELITEPLWSVASGVADLLRAEDETKETAADLRAGAISAKDAKRRLAEADKKRVAAKRRVRAALDQLRARIGELGGP